MATRRTASGGREVGWGGRRPGAGRRPGPRGGPAHRARPPHAARFPVLVTLRGRQEAPSLRAPAAFRAIRDALADAKAARGARARVLHFAARDGEVHILVEAHDAADLARGVQGLAVRLARALNRALARRGAVWAHRYRARELPTPRAVRDALVQVLGGGAGAARGRPAFDPCSSAPWFDGWRRAFAGGGAPEGTCPISAPRTWLAAVGWRRHGLLVVDERPPPRGSPPPPGPRGAPPTRASRPPPARATTTRGS